MGRGLNAPQVRKHNEAVILDLIRRRQPISRFELAQLSGLTPATMSTVVGRLLEMGVVQEGVGLAPRGSRRGGRRRIPLTLIPDSRLAGGILVNRGGAEGVVIDLSGRIHSQAQQRWRRQLFDYDGSEVAGFIRELTVQLLLDLPVTMQTRVVGYGVGVPNVVPKEWSWETLQTNLEAGAHHLTWCNNAVASAFGEWWTGKLPSSGSILYLFLGGGVGGCWIQSTHKHTSPHFQPVEVGHLGIAFDGPTCYCGASGCLEHMVGTTSDALNDPKSQALLIYALHSLALLFKLDLIVLGGPRVEAMSREALARVSVALEEVVPIRTSSTEAAARPVGTAATVFAADFLPTYAVDSQEVAGPEFSVHRGVVHYP